MADVYCVNVDITLSEVLSATFVNGRRGFKEIRLQILHFVRFDVCCKVFDVDSSTDTFCQSLVIRLNLA